LREQQGLALVMLLRCSIRVGRSGVPPETGVFGMSARTDGSSLAQKEPPGNRIRPPWIWLQRTTSRHCLESWRPGRAHPSSSRTVGRLARHRAGPFLGSFRCHRSCLETPRDRHRLGASFGVLLSDSTRRRCRPIRTRRAGYRGYHEPYPGADDKPSNVGDCNRQHVWAETGARKVQRLSERNGASSFSRKSGRGRVRDDDPGRVRLSRRL
jgi:hypothetical protein